MKLSDRSDEQGVDATHPYRKFFQLHSVEPVSPTAQLKQMVGEQESSTVSKTAASHSGSNHAARYLILKSKAKRPLDSTVSQINSNQDKRLCQKIFFKGLRKNTTKEKVVSALSRFGSVKHIYFPFCQKKGKNLGYGTVEYDSPSIHWYLLNGLEAIDVDGRLVKLVAHEIQSSERNQIPQNGTPNHHGHTKTEGSHQPVCLTNKLHTTKPTQSNYFLLRKRKFYQHSQLNIEMRTIGFASKYNT